ncbi:MAG: thermonuclease family protein [Pseudomonadota bacterium]
MSDKETAKTSQTGSEEVLRSLHGALIVVLVSPFVIGALAWGSDAFFKEELYPISGDRYEVARVIDGDTITFKQFDLRIRLFGIDAPEMDEPGGEAARDFLKSLISTGDLLSDFIEEDRFDRLVARLYLPNGQDVSALMIEAGHAVEFCLYSGNHYGTCGDSDA